MTFCRGENQWTAADDRKLSIRIEIPIEEGRYGSRVALIDGVQEAETTAGQKAREKHEEKNRRLSVTHEAKRTTTNFCGLLAIAAERGRRANRSNLVLAFSYVCLTAKMSSRNKAISSARSA